MPIRNLKVKEMAYNALKAEKRSSESFSDVILRVTKQDEAKCTKDKKNI